MMVVAISICSVAFQIVSMVLRIASISVSCSSVFSSLNSLSADMIVDFKLSTGRKRLVWNVGHTASIFIIELTSSGSIFRLTRSTESKMTSPSATKSCTDMLAFRTDFDAVAMDVIPGPASAAQRRIIQHPMIMNVQRSFHSNMYDGGRYDSDADLSDVTVTVPAQRPTLCFPMHINVTITTPQKTKSDIIE